MTATVRPVRYEVTAWPDDAAADYTWRRHFVLYVEWSHDDQWAIRDCWNEVYCRSSARKANPYGVWEPRPSERTPAFLRTYRFDLDTALALAQRIADRKTYEGRPAVECAAWVAARRAARAAETGARS